MFIAYPLSALLLKAYLSTAVFVCYVLVSAPIFLLIGMYFLANNKNLGNLTIDVTAKHDARQEWFTANREKILALRKWCWEGYGYDKIYETLETKDKEIVGSVLELLNQQREFVREFKDGCREDEALSEMLFKHGIDTPIPF